jgi:anti-sigma regulatory factor (Ser/Thr protein kinase)
MFSATPPTADFQHEAVFYDTMDDLVEVVAAFVREGLRNGEPVLVAELPPQVEALRARLGPDAERVSFVDMAEVGRNPACIIPVWREFVATHRGVPVRGVGEPAWVGRRPVELEECQLHEALLNVAFDEQADFRLMCPYDARALPQDVLAGAMRTHPAVDVKPRGASYGGHGHAVDGFTAPLTSAPARAREVGFGPGDLPWLRSNVRFFGEGARLPGEVVEDLVLAVHELATNSIEHGGGSGLLRAWSEPDSVVLEVADDGIIDDPLIGREPLLDLAEDGRGVWMVNHLCDLVQVRSSRGGTTVRLHTWT